MNSPTRLAQAVRLATLVAALAIGLTLTLLARNGTNSPVDVQTASVSANTEHSTRDLVESGPSPVTSVADDARPAALALEDEVSRQVGSLSDGANGSAAPSDFEESVIAADNADPNGALVAAPAEPTPTTRPPSAPATTLAPRSPTPATTTNRPLIENVGPLEDDQSPTPTPTPTTTPPGGGVDVDPSQIIEIIPGLPNNSEVLQVWQLDFNCHRDDTRNWFTPAAGIHSQIDLGFGTSWNDMRIKPNISNGNEFDEAFALDDFAVDNLRNSAGNGTNARFSVEGRVGCYARFNEAPATPTTAGSLFHDYMFFDLASGALGIGNPIDVHVENIPNGTYAVLLITSDWNSDRRWQANGEGISLNVPHAPRSFSITQNSVQTPKFDVVDGSIDMQWGAVDGNTHDASVGGIIVIQHQ